MASEAMCMSKKAKEFHREAILNQTDHMQCQSSFSSLYGHHGKLASEDTNGTLQSGHFKEKHLGVDSDEPCNAKANKTDTVSENRADMFISNRRTTVDAHEIACLNCEPENSNALQVQQYMRQQKGNTIQDLYMQEVYDDEDDDDSDWEPADHVVIKKWFCINCTMPNFDDGLYCDICGEPKDSEMFKQDLAQIGKAQLLVGSVPVSRDKDSSLKACTAIGFDERMLLHFEVEMKSHPHPERPDRVRAIAAALATAGIYPGMCSLIPAREITKEELQMVHSLDHIEVVEQTSRVISSYFTSDTYANEHSACAARLAAGVCADLASSIMRGHKRNGFALVRPPGHHAGIKQAMGFCLHNNAAVAALAAKRSGAKKVLIVDWDVHHGNGTQEIFESEKSVLYISLHRHEGGRFYPGTGAADEVGTLDGEGYCVNVPWSRGGVGDNDYIFAFQHIVLPIALDFAPDITIISAGFDAARGDPLGCCDVTPDGYAQMTDMLSAISQGRLLVILEGGYNLRSISSSAVAVIKVLVGEKPIYETKDVTPSKAGLQTVLQVAKTQLKYWPVLKDGYVLLQSQWEWVSSPERSNKVKKRKRLVGPFWWKWGSKRVMYELFYGTLNSREHENGRTWRSHFLE